MRRAARHRAARPLIAPSGGSIAPGGDIPALASASVATAENALLVAVTAAAMVAVAVAVAEAVAAAVAVAVAVVGGEPVAPWR